MPRFLPFIFFGLCLVALAGGPTPQAPASESAAAGPRTTLWPNGKRKAEEPLTGGKIDGLARYWDEEGNLIAERHYRAGQEDGTSVWYYPGGKVKAELHYHESVPDGEARWLERDGRLSSSGRFLAGRFVPDWAAADSTQDSTPWLGLAILALLSLLPLPLFLWKRHLPLQDLRSPVSVLCLVQGGMWLAAGVVLLQWMDRAPNYASPSLSCAALLLLLLGTGFVAVGFFILQDDDDLEPTPQPVKTALEVITHETRVFPAPRVLLDYRRRIVAIGILATGIAVCGPILAWGIGHEARAGLYLQWLLLGGVPVFSLGLGWALIYRRLDERTLCEKCKGRELLLNPEGLRAAIGLVDARTRGRMRQARREAWLFPWADIVELKLEPGRAPSWLFPARFRVKLRTPVREVTIRAGYFGERSEEILSLARQQLAPAEMKNAQ